MPIYNNYAPSLALTQLVNLQGEFPSRGGGGGGGNDFLGQVRLFAGNFAIYGTATANGQTLALSSNTALFSVMGTNFGGNGTSNFRLPDLAGRIAVGEGSGPGLSNYVIGEQDGSGFFNIYQNNLPPSSGGSAFPVANLQPDLGMHYMIQVEGLFPSQSAISHSGATTGLMGQVSLFCGNYSPGEYMNCDGRLLSIDQYSALYAILGTTYGGDGVSTFALPDLRGRTIIGAGIQAGTGITYANGQTLGTESFTVGGTYMPTNMGGSGNPIDNHSPSMAMNYIIAITGNFPSRNAITEADGDAPYLGEVMAFAGNFVPSGYLLCAGQLLAIATNQALFSILGTTYGGDGRSTFALPDLRGRDVIGTGQDSEGVTHYLGEVYGTNSTTISSADMPVLNFYGSGHLYGGDQSDNIHGGSAVDYIVGNAGSDTLDGAAGADTMVGGIGNDIYYVDDTNDVVTELTGQGTDIVYATASFTLKGDVENLTLQGTGNINGYGNGLNNTLVGNSGNNILSGGGGIDDMTGGLGNDTYMLDGIADVIHENVGEGTDTVVIDVSYTLGANLENLTVTGNRDASLTGNELVNVLTGNVGDNVLDGKVGADTMIGGGGNDTYYVDNAGDVVVESTGQGTDRVVSSIDYSLVGSFVETLQLTGTTAISATGNSQANTLIGNGLNNIIDGGYGADAMSGGYGDDTYYVENAGDVVTEIGGQGTDTIITVISYTLSANVDNLTLKTDAAVVGTGNGLANVMTGSNGANTIDGMGGNDTLTGRGGADTFMFTAASARDTITDFSTAEGDTINVHAVTNGTMPAGALHQVGSEVHIDLGGGNVIIVLNASATDGAFLSHIVW